MHNTTQRMMMGAAGAGGDKTYVEDLYQGQMFVSQTNGQVVPRRFNSGQALGSTGGGKALCLNAPSKDTTACFTKYPGFSGASSGKTFTISFWWWPEQTQTAKKIICFGQDNINRTRFDLTIGHYFAVNAWDSGGSRFLDVNTSSYQPLERGKWQHIIISFDLSDTGKRKAYINDTQVSNWTWGTYSNANIAWDSESIGLFCERGSGGNIFGTKCTGYVSNFYMDLTYTELGTESNRRIFRTSDGEPTSASSLSSRNPLIFMPLDDATTLETNLGTGGNMSKHDSGSQTYPVVDFGPYIKPADDVKGGLVVVKKRAQAANWCWFDTERGVNKSITSNSSSTQSTLSNSLIDFNSTGFTLGSNSDVNNQAMAAFAFTQHEKFLDIVYYTGNGTGQTISHNLKSTPGMMIIKRLDGSIAEWIVYHRSLGTNKYLQLSTNQQQQNDSSNYMWDNTPPTDTHFTVGLHDSVNYNTNTYIAYLFAHNDGDGIFGESGKEDVIKCGMVTNPSSYPPGTLVDLGFQPQFILSKTVDYNNTSWYLRDTTMGMSSPDDEMKLVVNSNQGKTGGGNGVDLRSNGFVISNLPAFAENLNGSRSAIYMAIGQRSGKLSRPPETDTAEQYFAMDYGTGNTSYDTPNYDSSPNNGVEYQFPVDFTFAKKYNGSGNWMQFSRPMGLRYLELNNVNTLQNHTTEIFAYNDGWDRWTDMNSNWLSWMFKRSAAIDVTLYEGNGQRPHVIPHNLGSVPKMMWLKSMDQGNNWTVYHYDIFARSSNSFIYLNSNTSENAGNINTWNGTAPTATNFTIGDSAELNTNQQSHQAILFGDVNGVSKVGAYTGTGNSNEAITTGFQPRIILIKAAVFPSGSRNWVLFDSKRGWTNKLYTNQNQGQSSQTSLGINSTGFTLPDSSNDYNENNSKYIYWAHA